MTLTLSFPVWVSIFAHFLWKNDMRNPHSAVTLDVFGWFCSLFGFLGVVFVAQPSFIFKASKAEDDDHRMSLGIMLGMGSSACAGAQYVIVNYTKKYCHWLQLEQSTSAISLFVFCPMAALAFALYDYRQNGGAFHVVFESQSSIEWLEEIGLGVLGFLALALLTRGAQLDVPERTAICLYLQTPFVYLGQFYKIGHGAANIYVYVGMFLVFFAVITPAIRKLRKRNADQLEMLEAQRKEEELSESKETTPLIQGGATNMTV